MYALYGTIWFSACLGSAPEAILAGLGWSRCVCVVMCGLGLVSAGLAAIVLLCIVLGFSAGLAAFVLFSIILGLVSAGLRALV